MGLVFTTPKTAWRFSSSSRAGSRHFPVPTYPKDADAARCGRAYNRPLQLQPAIAYNQLRYICWE